MNDPAVARKYRAILRGMLRITKQDYAKVLHEERWLMTEKHWRARWDLTRIDPDYKPLADAIPERLRLQFAAEDAKQERQA